MGMNAINMTTSRADELFRTATPILGVTLTPQHLDMLSCGRGGAGLELQACIARASDDLAAGRLHTPDVQAVVAEFNRRVGG